jgi:hypothetical protein
MIEGSGADPYLVLTDPDPGGTKTYGSGSAAQVTHINYPTHRFEKIPILSRETAALKQQQGFVANRS